ncbi:hypothetical protein HMPREF9696_04044 [Afipia clevelandensis ATCC 49720]|uniref:Porin n=1 Tax=Afipia clevelandensis ATCC 49720 TaxID=883079 RepID=K8P069_9BRAD|nr:hypothetical protein HMPREF9696_04044 [Afipia clevelandensis ATCC 49720]
MRASFIPIIKHIAVVGLSIILMSAAQAQQNERRRPHLRLKGAAQYQPLKPARPQRSACSEFGPGFVRMPGSDSCIRFGGGVGIGVGAVP